jgi:hypothetical protein
MDNHLVNLSKFITTYFNLDEIRTLCFSLGIDYEELGEGGKTAKTQNLLLTLGRKERLDELIVLLNQLRPNPFHQANLSTNPAFIDSLYSQLPSFSNSKARPKEENLLIQKVESFWVEGVLKDSLYNNALIELGVEYRPESIAYPWQTIVHPPEREPYILSANKSIEEVFDEASQSLLILGSPGSGKTTMLLALAKDLLNKAKLDPTFPIPVIFNLSTLSIGISLDDWLVKELNEKYLIPKRFGQKWVDDDKLLLLLDGFDEISREYQNVSTEVINEFRQEHLVGLVVCSRIKEYEAITQKLKLESAVYLQPLTTQQIKEFILLGGEKLNSLHILLNNNDALSELAQSPLMLGIMSLAYQDVPTESLFPKLENSEDSAYKFLFDLYIKKMFERKGTNTTYTFYQTKKYLSWLAQQMSNHNQSIVIEQLIQPSWLSNRFWQIIYAFYSRLGIGLMVGLCLGFVSFAFNVEFRPFPLVNWLENYVRAGGISGIILFLIAVFRFEFYDRFSGTRKLLFNRFSLADGIITGLVTFVLLVPYYSVRKEDLFFSSFFGAAFGLCYGIIAGFRERNGSWNNDIQVIEGLSWSWRDSIKWGAGGAIFGLVLIWALIILGDLPSNYWEHAGITTNYYVMTLAYLLGIGLWVSASLYGGLKTVVSDIDIFPKHNSTASLKNIIFIGIIFGVTVTIITGFLQIPFNVYYGNGLEFALIWKRSASFGVGLGLFSGFWYGGFDFYQHYVLYFILFVRGDLPLKFSRFVDFAKEKIFLRNIGTGYVFIHKLLMEHFSLIKPESDTEIKTYSKKGSFLLVSFLIVIYSLFTFGGSYYDQITVYYNNKCWNESVSGNAAEVMSSCDLAVRLAPNSGITRDSRGLARALIGDCTGAVEDFKFAVEWFEANTYDPNLIQDRETWIVLLNSRQNPFLDGASCWK